MLREKEKGRERYVADGDKDGMKGERERMELRTLNGQKQQSCGGKTKERENKRWANPGESEGERIEIKSVGLFKALGRSIRGQTPPPQLPHLTS